MVSNHACIAKRRGTDRNIPAMVSFMKLLLKPGGSGEWKRTLKSMGKEMLNRIACFTCSEALWSSSQPAPITAKKIPQLTCEAPNVSKEGETQQNHHAVNLLEQNHTRRKTNAFLEGTHEKNQTWKKKRNYLLFDFTGWFYDLFLIRWLWVG